MSAVEWSSSDAEAKPPIPVADEVALFEIQCHLPLLLGTPRQVDWARNIRRHFLKEVFTHIMEKTATLAPDQAKAVYSCLDAIRADRDSRHWIETYRPQLGDATGYVLGLPAAIAAHRKRVAEEKAEQQRKQQKAQETRRLTVEAGKWETVNNLPVIEGKSTAQTNFARRCRYQLLKVTPGSYPQKTEAGYWIRRFLDTQQEAAPESA